MPETLKKLKADSYAKINLYLKVLSKRRDNYHSIKTLFARISLADTLTFRLRRDGAIRISSSSKELPAEAHRNLAYIAASLLQREGRVSLGADIMIRKRIPVGAGLGGGSSNAATTLIVLNKLWRLGFSKAKLLNLAAKVGSDVAFFLQDTHFALGTGRGEKIKPVAALRSLRLWLVLLVPRVNVPTPAIYDAWDKAGSQALTKPACDVKITILALQKRDVALASGALFNDLQAVACARYPEVSGALKELRARGVRAVLMSGSGPAVFGICSSRKKTLSLVRKIRKQQKAWRIFAVFTR